MREKNSEINLAILALGFIIGSLTYGIFSNVVIQFNWEEVITNPNFLGSALGSFIAALVPIFLYFKERNRAARSEFIRENSVFESKFYDIYKQSDEIKKKIKDLYQELNSITEFDYKVVIELEGKIEWPHLIDRFKEVLNKLQRFKGEINRFQKMYFVDESTIPIEIIETIRYLENNLDSLRRDIETMESGFIYKGKINKLKSDLDIFQSHFDVLISHYEKLLRIKIKHI